MRVYLNVISHLTTVVFSVQSELGLADMKLKDQISERDRMIEEIQSSLKQIQVSFHLTH